MTVYQSTNLAMRMEYDSNNNAIYVAEGKPGANDASIAWRIKKITYDVNNNATHIKWASGTPKFNKSWDDRTTYTYS